MKISQVERTHVVRRLFILVMLLMCLSVSQSFIQSLTPLEQLQEMVGRLQKAPADQDLREQIIKLALTLDPSPTVPEEADKFDGRAEYAFKNAESEADYADAAKEYEKASLIAPWVAAYYFNCGIAHEKASNLEAAIRNFNFYLLAAPDAPDTRDVRKRIAGLEYASERAASEVEAEAQESELQKSAQAEADRRIRKQSASLAGRWLEFGRYDDKRDERQANKHFHYEFEIMGTNLVKTMVCVVATTEADQMGVPCEQGKRIENWSLPIQGNRISGQDNAGNTWEGLIGEGTIIMHWINVRGKEVRYEREN